MFILLFSSQSYAKTNKSVAVMGNIQCGSKMYAAKFLLKIPQILSNLQTSSTGILTTQQ